MIDESVNLCIAILQKYIPGEAAAMVIQVIGPAVVSSQVSVP